MEQELVRATSHNSLLKKQLKCIKNIEKDYSSMKTLKEKAENELKEFKKYNIK